MAESKISRQLLQARRNNKKLHLEAIYYKEWKKCELQISDIDAKFRITETVYSVPASIRDEPDYDFVDCLLYIIEQLKKGDFRYKYSPSQPTKLYISWSLENTEEDKKNKIKKLLQMTSQPYLAITNGPEKSPYKNRGASSPQINLPRLKLDSDKN